MTSIQCGWSGSSTAAACSARPDRRAPARTASDHRGAMPFPAAHAGSAESRQPMQLICRIDGSWEHHPAPWSTSNCSAAGHNVGLALRRQQGAGATSQLGRAARATEPSACVVCSSTEQAAWTPACTGSVSRIPVRHGGASRTASPSPRSMSACSGELLSWCSGSWGSQRRGARILLRRRIPRPSVRSVQRPPRLCPSVLRRAASDFHPPSGASRIPSG